MSFKDVLKLLALAAVFFAVAPYLLNGINRLRYPGTTYVSYATALAGHISGGRTNRQYTLNYLDDNEKQYYDFNGFVPDSVAPEMVGLSQDDKNRLMLGAHLRQGDYVSKAANSTKLTVQRGNSITHWVCPAGPQP